MQSTLYQFRPRVSSLEFGPNVLLEDVMDHVVFRKRPCTVIIRGPRYTLLLCEPLFGRPIPSMKPAFRRAISSIKHRMLDSIDEECTIRFFGSRDDCDPIRLTLSPWSLDDSIEYLLARFPDCCPSVIGRLTDRQMTYEHLTPFLWTQVLDEMAKDREATEPISILAKLTRVRWQEFLDQQAQNRKKPMWFGLPSPPTINELLERLIKKRSFQIKASDYTHYPSHAMKILAFTPVLHFLMSEWLADRIRTGNLSILKNHYPPDLLRSAATLVRDDAEAKSQMVFGLTDSSISSTCASILSFTGSPFQPPPNSIFNLRHAQLEKVHWIGASVKSLDTSHGKFDQCIVERCSIEDWKAIEYSLLSVSFRNCDLHRFTLENSWIAQAEFHSCNLSGCDMTNTELNGVELTDCEMSHGWFTSCKMTDVSMQRCKLTLSRGVHSVLKRLTIRYCTFDGANWSGVDFRKCVLENVSFKAANLEHSNLDELDLLGCQFAKAKMEACSMTGTRLRNASLADARLRFAKLGYVDWQGCNLRNADLSGCLFHLGGSRSGLVGSPYPSHGTRTGFYRDDLEELIFKDPQDVCRARIVQCDLTGAKIQDVDFYLVDLRGSIVSASQRDQILSTGGIIDG